MCDNVLPVLSNIAKPEGSGDDVDVQLDVLKLFAELSVHCGDVENLENKIGKLFNKLVVSTQRGHCFRQYCVTIFRHEGSMHCHLVGIKMPEKQREGNIRKIQHLFSYILHKWHQNCTFPSQYFNAFPWQVNFASGQGDFQLTCPGGQFEILAIEWYD